MLLLLELEEVEEGGCVERGDAAVQVAQGIDGIQLELPSLSVMGHKGGGTGRGWKRGREREEGGVEYVAFEEGDGERFWGRAEELVPDVPEFCGGSQYGIEGLAFGKAISTHSY